MKNPHELKKSVQNDNITQRLYDSATLTLSREDRRAQRISNLMSIADDPSDADARRDAEIIIDEIS